ncbi:PREDICTED: psbP domain-containing protein 3, chloroplastic isoform X1 [Theobroma cacao]|uniref:PsbP domain-containing protein 3, chloroplastic isoform X1 n=2 Tax=Theobroma cacao TaxID=3641 RepID=A0AB32WUQ5_THECC|nr:PREDICTED: psbP domain-containing protein 3, chloroplastic isoform X1 [Theobroma cacao]EOY15892.1 Photosystem II reaction center PsbP family protein isoform 1 [Theobroma cacao]
MATVSSLHCCNISSCLNQKGVIVSASSITTRSNSNSRKQPPFCCCNSYRPQHEEKKKPFIRVQEVKEDGHGHEHATRRRQIMLQGPLIAFSFPQFVSAALAGKEPDVPQDFRAYTDDVNKFKIFIPQDWQVGAGEPNGFKSITAFFPEEEAANSNVSVVITGLGPDFTRMESFGKVEAFADTLVSGLDRSWQRPPGVAAKLIDCKAANGFYYIEYTLQNPGESRKHLFSAIGMASNGWYNRLYTVTGQFVDDEAEKYGSRIEKAVSSFRFI